MDFYKRPQSNTLRWLVFSGAAAGTLLLAYIPCAAWLTVPEGAEPALALFLLFVKQALTVSLLLIVPALWARTAHRCGAWALAVLACLAFGFGYALKKDAAFALYTMLFCTLPGAGLFLLQKGKLTNFRTVLYESVLVLIALFLYLCLPSWIESRNAYLPFRSVVLLYERMVEGLAPYASAESGLEGYYTALHDMVTLIKLNPETIGIPALAAVSMCAGLSNVLFSHLLNCRGGAQLVKLPPFSEWRCERVFVFAATGFAVVTYAMALFGVSGMDTLASVALLVWRLPCALAGLSAIRRVSLRTHKNWIFVIVCLSVLLLPSFWATALGLIGMIASLRMRTYDGKDGSML